MLIVDLNKPEWWTRYPFAPLGKGKICLSTDPMKDPLALKCHGKRTLLDALYDAPPTVEFNRQNDEHPFSFYFDFWEAKDRKHAVQFGKSLPGAGFAAWCSAKRHGQQIVFITTMPHKHPGLTRREPFQTVRTNSLTAKDVWLIVSRYYNGDRAGAEGGLDAALDVVSTVAGITVGFLH
jgi:hypothetical protein